MVICRRVCTLVILFTLLCIQPIAQFPTEFKNDSILISNVLKTSDRDVEYIGDNSNGVLRKYIFFENRWILAGLEYRKNGDWLWAVKGISDQCWWDCINPNWDILPDSADIAVPDECGRIMLQFSIKGKKIVNMILYYPNGSVQHVMDFHTSTYQYHDTAGRMRVRRVGIIQEGGALFQGKEEHFNEDGLLVEEFEMQRGERVN